MKSLGSAFGMGVLGGVVYWFWRYLTPRHSSLMLQEKVVVLTGASSGLGQGLALAFARRGSRVVLVSRRPERLEVVQREIEPYASAVLTVQADITDSQQRQHIIDAAMQTFGRIDVLVNGAGIMAGGLLSDHDPAQVEQMTTVNLNATMLLIQLVVPVMLARNEGYVVNLGSSMSRTAAPAYAPYVASQYGLAGFSDSLRRELAGTGIQVMLALSNDLRTEIAAEAIVEALVQGRREIVVGNLRDQVGLAIERYLPAAARLYWTWIKTNTRWIETARKTTTSD